MSPDGIIIGSTKRFRPSQGMQSRAFPPSGDPGRNRLFPPYYPAWLRSDRRRHEPGCAVKYEKGRAALTLH